MPYSEHGQLGKFEGCYSIWTGEVLYTITMESGCSEDLGDVQDYGWYGLIHGNRWSWIVKENSQGFFDYEQFDCAADADATWAQIEDDYQAYMAESDQEE